MANRISVIIDVAVDKANASLGSFRKSIADADGTVGKFKAGASGAFDAVKANAGNLAMAGGAALFTFGAKAVSAFQETALEAGRMSEALGMPVDAISRLIEISGDLGIESGTLEKSLGKMNQTAGKSPAAFDDIGAAIARNADGTMNVNQTFLNTVDALNRIPDAGRRAAAAQQIFGRGWRDMAELINQGSDTIISSMEGVSEAQAISPEEVQKARDYKAAMENLKDALGKVTLAAGEALTPALTTIANAIGVITDAVLELEDKTGVSLFDGLFSADFWKFGPAWDNGPGKILKEITGFEGAAPAAEIDDVTDSFGDQTEVLEGNAEALRDRVAAMEASEAAERGAQSASLAYRQQVADTTAAVQEATLKQQDATLTDAQRAQAARDAEAAVLAQADAAVKYAEEQAAANGETFSAQVKTQIYVDELETLAATLSGPARAEIEAHIRLLKGIPASIYTNIGVTRSGDLSPVITGKRASGGPVSAGGAYLVGEQGPEILQMGSSGGNVIPNGGIGGATFNVTVNAGMGADGAAIGNTVIDMIRAYERRNGPGWRS